MTIPDRVKTRRNPNERKKVVSTIRMTDKDKAFIDKHGISITALFEWALDKRINQARDGMTIPDRRKKVVSSIRMTDKDKAFIDKHNISPTALVEWALDQLREMEGKKIL